MTKKPNIPRRHRKSAPMPQTCISEGPPSSIGAAVSGCEPVVGWVLSGVVVGGVVPEMQ
jgi:hypothetical protein